MWIWLPNIEEFFVSLGNQITSAQRQRLTLSYDFAEFFLHLHQENERTLATLTLRIEESFFNEGGLINDLNELHSIVNKLTRDFVVEKLWKNSVLCRHHFR